MKKVALISMPFSTISFPSVGISMLKAALARNRIECDVLYFNFEFAYRIGLEHYETLVNYHAGYVLAGERLFADHVFGSNITGFADYLHAYAGGLSGLSSVDLSAVHRATAPFLDWCVHAADWDDYDVVGFSSVFEQQMASLALARRIKTARPNLQIVFGGANWEDRMGVRLHEKMPFVDLVCQGEADETFPALIHCLRTGSPIDGIPGVIYRVDGASKTTGGPAMVSDMDCLPIPDYDDYFVKLAQYGWMPVCGGLPMETSRGCWWGKKAKCRFCGTNDRSIDYRSKNPGRALTEVRTLTRRYLRGEIADLRVYMVDNILDPRYFTTFLPELAKAPCARAFFYEVKANLKPEELDLLARCGVDWIQPGIESLNDHVLSIMKKGTTALRNIQLLKLCSERGIRPIWNLLCGVPGERSEDYRATLDLIPLITHLPPPVSCATITIHRFSPFFEQPGPSGLRNLRPQSGYRAVYPFSEAELFDVAYEFDCDFDRAEFSEEYFHDLQTMVQYWQERFDAGMERLSLARLGPDACVILDRRVATGAARTVLRGLDCAIYSFCGTIRNAQSVLTHLRASFPNKAVSERETKDRLDRLVALRFMVNEGDCYLGLATPSRSWPAK